MFRNDNDLKNTLNILEKLYKQNKFVYSAFAIKDNTITFSADSYYDPVLTLLTLKEFGIMDLSVKNISNETDEITITNCNVDALKMISERSPTYKNIQKLCEEQKIFSSSIDKKNANKQQNTLFFAPSKQDAQIECDPLSVDKIKNRFSR